jgi:hypothetical protein
MWDNISWLDIVSFLVSVITTIVAFRLDYRQSKILKDIKKREDEIKESQDKTLKEIKKDKEWL